MYFDSHAHLEMPEFDEDRDDVVARAQRAGLVGMVTVGTNFKDCHKAIELAHRYPVVYAAIGIHPHEAKAARPETLDNVVALTKDERVVAWGEIGLDFYRSYAPPEVQEEAFIAQLHHAERCNLPVIIHSRNAHEKTRDILFAHPNLKGVVIHCFSGNRALARQFLDRGYYISIAGNVTFKNALTLKEVAHYVPIDRLLIETDAPFLAPHPHRGTRNEPGRVLMVATEVARLKQVPTEVVARATTENAYRFYGLSAHYEG